MGQDSTKEVSDVVTLREYFDARFDAVSAKIDSLATLTSRELALLAEDRQRQRDDLRERLEGMNALRAQPDRQADTIATRERLDAPERSTWRALGLLAGIVLVIQIIGTAVVMALLR